MKRQPYWRSTQQWTDSNTDATVVTKSWELSGVIQGPTPTTALRERKPLWVAALLPGAFSGSDNRYSGHIIAPNSDAVRCFSRGTVAQH